MKKVLFATASFVAFAIAGAANAADLGRPVYKTPAPAPLPPVQDWSGIYVGAEGGYGWGHQDGFTVPFLANPGPGQLVSVTLLPISFTQFQDFQEDLNAIRGNVAVPLGNVNNSGWLFGAFFGAQKQWGNWVLGLEGDIDGANMKGSVSGSASASIVENEAPITLPPNPPNNSITEASQSVSLEHKIDMLASVRGKIGWAISPNWLIYGTGGMGFAHVKNSLSADQFTNFGVGCLNHIAIAQGCDSTFPFANAFTAFSDQSVFGWTLGAGIDWKFQVDQGSAWVFGVEYLHYSFPSQTFTYTDNTGLSFASNSKLTVDAVKGRISYLFSIH